MASYGIIGGGSWGTALALHLHRGGHRVALWLHGPRVAREIESCGENRTYLPGFPVPEAIRCTNRIVDVVTDADRILVAVPSHHCRQVLREVRAAGPGPDAAFLLATKGIEEQGLLRMTQILDAVWEEPLSSRAGVISGPSFAREVARGDPTAVVVASASDEIACLFQEEMSHGTFRCYRNPDVVGVELGGSLKNIIAIAAGVVSGLGMGHNTTAALLTRGLAEMTRFSVGLGAEERTLSGLAGMGDLVLTCTGHLSRNRQVGISLGEGKSLQEITAGMRMVAEGIRTARAVRTLARRHGVNMPITEEVFRLLFEADRSPREAIRELLDRPLIREGDSGPAVPRRA
jgi:glycerol-3-phosphate dehydrogenase (NAD(P)+)